MKSKKSLRGATPVRRVAPVAVIPPKRDPDKVYRRVPLLYEVSYEGKVDDRSLVVPSMNPITILDILVIKVIPRRRMRIRMEEFEDEEASVEKTI